MLALGVSAAVAAALLPLAAARPAVREIVLVTRDMAYYVDGEPTRNPVIRLERGERIALTLHNEDRGIAHDFTVADWGIRTRKLQGYGSERITFTVPDILGSFEYVCTPHSTMMRGSVVVE